MTDPQSRFFTLAWFGAMFRGELSLGDTFWGGAFGVQLIFVPLWIAAEFFVQLTFPSLEPTVFLASNAIFMVYSLLLMRAVFVVAKLNTTAGGWRWAAVAYCAASAALFAKLLVSAF